MKTTFKTLWVHGYAVAVPVWDAAKVKHFEGFMEESLGHPVQTSDLEYLVRAKMECLLDQRAGLTDCQTLLSAATYLAAKGWTEIGPTTVDG